MTTTNNTNIQDLIKSFSANAKTTAENYQKNLKNVKCVSSADLMSNYIAGTSIDARFQFEVVQDANGDPILFSISSPEDTGGGANVNQLYVTMRDETTPTGWTQFNISPTATDSVTIIGVSQDLTTGDYVLAAATATNFYITSTIPSDTTKTDWANFAADWCLRPGMPAGASVTKILVGENQTVGKLPLIVAAVQIGNDAEHYFVNGDTTVTENCWSVYVLPAQTAEMIDLAIGMVWFDQNYWLGTYALYTVGSDLNLSFSSVPDAENITHSFALAAPAGTTVLQTLPDINDANVSTLFVSGNGLYVYESQAQMDAINPPTNPPPSGWTKETVPAALISDDAAFSNVTQMLARQDDSHVSLWVRNSSQVLWYVRGDQLGADDDAPRNWTTPLSLRQNVARIAAIRNKNRQANGVLMVKSDGQTVAYLWQDPTTTLWKESDMPLPALSTVQEFPCYTSVLAFTDENGNPVINQEIQITSSQWTYATVNGFYKTLDSTTPVSVATDTTGKVTIINKVTGISTPSFSANAKIMTASQTINPAQKVLAGLANIKTGQDLLNAKTNFATAPDPTNNPEQYVITGDLRNNQTQLDNIAASIQQSVQMAGTLPDTSDSSSSIASRGSSFQPWGLSFAGGGATFFNGDAALNLFPQSDSFTVGTVANAIVSVAGDVFETMLHGIEKVGQILVQAAGAVYNICVQIGEQVLSFVIQTIGDVLNLLSWIFQAIEIGMDQLIGWLGFLFEWDDIITTHKVFTNMTIQSINYASALLKDAETPINNFFDELKTKLKNLPILQIPAANDVNLLQTNAAATQTDSSSSATVAQLQSNTGFNFASYQMSHGVGNSGGGSNSTANIDIDDKTTDDLETLAGDLINVFDQFIKDNEATVKSLMTLISDNQFTLSNVAKTLTEGVITTILDAVQGIITLMIDLVEVIVDYILKILTADIEIPFISGLYKSVTGGSDFSLLDSISLFCSIPATVGYKIFYSEAPFANGTFGLDTMTYSQIFPALPGAPMMRAASLTASATADDSGGDWKVVYSRIGGFAYNIGQVLTGIITALEWKGFKKTANFLSFINTALTGIIVATAFPFKEGDTQADEAEWGIDIFLWLGDVFNLILKSVLLILENLGKMGETLTRYVPTLGAIISKADDIAGIEEEIAEFIQSIYEFILGAYTLALNIVSCGIEYEGAQNSGADFDWWKQIQNFATAGEELSGGASGCFKFAFETTKLEGTGGLTTFFAFCENVLACGSAVISFGRMLETEEGEIFHIR